MLSTQSEGTPLTHAEPAHHLVRLLGWCGHAVRNSIQPPMTQSGRGAKKHDAVQQGVVDSPNELYGTLPSSGSTSLRLDVCRPDHLAPLLGFFGHGRQPTPHP
jgi:hypothetical protein